MIRFALECEKEHQFESWFQSNDAFDDLNKRNLIACPTCNSTKVTKSLMAPKVRTSRKTAIVHDDAPVQAPTAGQAMTTPDPDVAEAIQKLKSHVEKNSDYVGDDFAKEARAMHQGDVPQRSIHGQAKPEEARKLIEDGVPALPLPFIPKQKTN